MVLNDSKAPETTAAPAAGDNALQASELQLRQLAAAITDCAIYMLDLEGRVVSWNPGAQRIKGYGAAEVIGRHFSEFYTSEDRANQLPSIALAAARRDGKYEAEGWRVRKDGTRFWASVLMEAIVSPSGEMIGFAKVTRDMTERRAIQEQLHQSQKMEAVGQLTGGVAHDFNNLLTVIIGNLDAIERRLPEGDERLQRAVDQAMQGARRAATLAQQLLAFARRQPLDPRPTDLNQLINGMSELLHSTLGEQVIVERILDEDLWTVNVDPHQFESALLNLAVNARDAMAQGGRITIETCNTEVDADYAWRYETLPGPHVIMSVSDTGTGMSAEVLARAFEPFFTTKPIGSGTGLGLSQVFGFVKQSGGHIRLHSAPDEGTVAKIYLPRYRGDAVQYIAGAHELPSRARGVETILVVEDDVAVRAFSTESLRELGFAVLEAADGPSALRVLAQHPEIKLLFTDVGLPGMNGRELVDEVRRIRPDVRVLFTSGYAQQAIVEQGRLAAGVNLLTKPFTRVQLAARIRELLDLPAPAA